MEEHLEKVGIELKPGAIEILTYLKEKGIHRAISTANDIERAEKYLKKIGLYGYFDKIICAPMVEHGKPAPDVYEFACSELKPVSYTHLDVYKRQVNNIRKHDFLTVAL